MSDLLHLNNSGDLPKNTKSSISSALSLKIKDHFESDQFYQAIAKKGEDLVLALNPEGVLEFVGASVEQVLGYREEDLLNKNILSFTFHRYQ